MAIWDLLSQTMGASASTAAGELDKADWIALASATISVLALLVTIYFARGTEAAGKTANAIAVGQAETQLRALIINSQQWMDQCNVLIVTFRKGRKEEELSSDEKSIYEVHLANYDKAVAQHLNSYEDACAKYIDKKIDTRRFKMNYSSEILHLCEKERGTIHKFLHPRTTSSYKAIWTVYEEWNKPADKS